MKTSPLNHKTENEVAAMETFDREKVMKAFKRMGFMHDYETSSVTVLRNSNFPFQRIVVPSIKSIHIELLKLYAGDLRIPISQLLNLINKNAKPYS